ncbi:hypothetical protein SOVF_107860 [Spinacia oleracea]|nr:hypothetical protein SOVF_107860 [Spinacia oleracea]
MVGRLSAMYSSTVGVIGPSNHQHQQLGHQNDSPGLGFDLNFPPTMVVPPPNQFTHANTLHVADQGPLTFPPLYQGGSTTLPTLSESLLPPLPQSYLLDTLLPPLPPAMASTQIPPFPSYMLSAPRMVKRKSEDVGDIGQLYMLFPNDRFGLVYADYSARLGCSPNNIEIIRVNGLVIPAELTAGELNIQDGETLCVRGLLQDLNVNTHYCTFFIRPMVDRPIGWTAKAAYDVPLWKVIYDWAALLKIDAWRITMYRNFKELPITRTIRESEI